jgi:hypothetical protein
VSRGPLLSTLLLLGCASARTPRPPTHEQLVNHHMQGKYDEVVRWCPVILDAQGADPRLSDWCLFGYPAALRLSLDTTAALGFVRSVCTDVTGEARGDENFRVFYVREVTRWVALPMRLQKQDVALPRAVNATVHDYSEVCLVDPQAVRAGLDTTL